MNIRTIKDLLIDAVRLDRETHEHVGPARLRAQQIVYEHDFADRAGWGKALGDKECQLDREDADPYGPKGHLSRSFWDQFDREPSAAEISRAQIVHSWITLIDDEKDRRALIGWLHSKAGGKSFRRWCKVIEGISQTTGLKRKNRALEKLQENIPGNGSLHDISGLSGGLPFAVDFSDLSATIAAGADDEIDGIDRWATVDAKSPMQAIVPPSEFNWARKQNARRRQRAAEKAKKQAAA